MRPKKFWAAILFSVARMDQTSQDRTPSPSRTSDADLDCLVVESTLVFNDPKIGEARPGTFRSSGQSGLQPSLSSFDPLPQPGGANSFVPISGRQVAMTRQSLGFHPIWLTIHSVSKRIHRDNSCSSLLCPRTTWREGNIHQKLR